MWFFFFGKRAPTLIQASSFPPSPKSTRIVPPPAEWGALCLEFPEHSPMLKSQCEWRGSVQAASLKPTPLPRSLFALDPLKEPLLLVARYSLATFKPNGLLYLWPKLFNGFQNTCLSAQENTFQTDTQGRGIASGAFAGVEICVLGVLSFFFFLKNCHLPRRSSPDNCN